MLLLALLAASGIFQVVEGWWHYTAHLEGRRTRLQISARRHAEWIQSVGRPENSPEVGGETANLAALTRKIEAARLSFREDEKEDLVLGRLEGQSIRFLVREEPFLTEFPVTVPLRLDQPTPMYRALQGQSGTIITQDHRGETVLAAYEPVTGQELGLVMHTNLAGVRRSYLHRQGLWRGLGILLVLGGIAIAAWMLIPPPRRREGHPAALASAQIIDQVRISDRLVLEEGQHIDEIQTWVPAEGLPLVHRIYKVPLRDENGKVEGIVGFAENITELKTTQRILKENRNLLNTVFDSVPIGISVKDAQGRYRMANTIFGTLFGLHSPSILGKTFAQVNQGGDAESRRVEEADRELLETGKRVDRPLVRVEMPGGGEEWRHIIKTPLFDDSGANTGVVTVVVDITKEVESEQALMDSWTTLQLAQEISRIGILDWNIRTGDMKWSDHLYRIFGHSPQDITPTLETYLQFAHPEDQSLIEHALKQAMEDRKRYSFQHRFIRADQEVGTLQGQGRVFYDEQDRPVRMLGVIEDITDHITALARLQDYSARLLQSNRDLEDFATIASHDLQEPLRKINLFSDRLKLQDWEHLSKESRNFVDRIASTSERMRSLVQGLLTYSKINTNKNRFIVVDLGQVIGEVVEDLKTEVEGSRARNLWGDLPEIEGDPRLIHQLFHHLIGNALKFRREGIGPVIEVTRAPLTLKPLEGGALVHGVEYCQINVKDNGIGFDSRYARKIFKIFQRLHHPSEYQGVGIGLTLCRKIMDLHGGRIAAQGEASQGAVFMFALPTRQKSSPGHPGPLELA